MYATIYIIHHKQLYVRSLKKNSQICKNQKTHVIVCKCLQMFAKVCKLIKIYSNVVKSPHCIAQHRYWWGPAQNAGQRSIFTLCWVKLKWWRLHCICIAISGRTQITIIILYNTPHLATSNTVQCVRGNYRSWGNSSASVGNRNPGQGVPLCSRARGVTVDFIVIITIVINIFYDINCPTIGNSFGIPWWPICWQHWTRGCSITRLASLPSSCQDSLG